MKRRFRKVFYIAISILLIFQLVACGYFIYPERRGQKPVGRIDPAIAILDALGLLLFIVPGVIAFAVDITNGTLYFPSSRRHSSLPTEADHITIIKVNPAKLNEGMIKEIIKKQTGISIKDIDELLIYELDRSEDIERKLAEVERFGYRID